MENNSSQGSRIQASRAVSCSGHTTWSAQKLSSRDTWQTTGSEVRLTRATPEQGRQGRPQEDPLPLPGSWPLLIPKPVSLPIKDPDSVF